VPESLTRHAVAATSREQVIGLTLQQDFDPRTSNKITQPVLSFVTDRDQSLALTLASHPQNALVQVDLALLQVDQLGYPQTGGVQHLEHGAIPMTERVMRIGRAEQGINLTFSQGTRQ